MKVIVLLFTSFLTSAAFAANIEIQCTERGNSAVRLQIFYNTLTFKIEGISLFNTSAEQTAQDAYKKALSQYTHYSYFTSVALSDNTEILIPRILLDGKTKGIVHTDDGREFNCN